MAELEKYKIAIILGTRAELIKTFPVMRALQDKKLPYYFIHTGQHSLGDLCKVFSVKQPDTILSKEPKRSSKFDAKQTKALFWNFFMVGKIRRTLKRLRGLKYVLYHGDTMTTADAALASSSFLNPLKKYKNVHLEAGLRSGRLFEPFPEEIVRRFADRLSDILIAVSKHAENNLRKEGNRGKIITFGNTIVDSADIAYKIAQKRGTKILSKGRFALITVHRHENIKSKKRLRKIIEILSSLEIPAYFPLHDNTKKKIMDFGLYNQLASNKNIHLIEPMDYPSFIYQLKHCSLLICDGGSMQEESLIFQKPCIILRKATERQEGLETNFNYLSNLEVDNTKGKINEFFSKGFEPHSFKNPYGEKGLSRKIVNLLK